MSGSNLPMPLLPQSKCMTKSNSRCSRTLKEFSLHSVNIIGAGPGGLAAAMLLRQAGLHVRLIEQKPYVGGRCSAIEEAGYRFDLGPTFFLYPQVLERIFRITGRELFDEIEMVRLDPQYRVIFGGGRGQLDCTPDLQRMAEEVGRISPSDANNVKTNSLMITVSSWNDSAPP